MPQIVSVDVPAGIAPGELFSVEYQGRNYDVACPDDCAEGDEIDIELPDLAWGALKLKAATHVVKATKRLPELLPPPSPELLPPPSVGVTLFGRETCGMCKHLVSQLNAAGISHTLVSCDTQAGSRELWQALSQVGHKGSVGLPVVKVGEQVKVRVPHPQPLSLPVVTQV